MVSNRFYYFQTSVNVLSNNIAEHGWRINDLHDDEAMADLSQAVFMWFNNDAFKHTNIHREANTHIPTHSDECNRRECNALHFA